jgi:hypothetical protein
MTGHQTSTSRVIHVGAADKVHMRAEYKRARACGCEFPCPLVQFMYENRSVAKADSAVTEGKLRKNRCILSLSAETPGEDPTLNAEYGAQFIAGTYPSP